MRKPVHSSSHTPSRTGAAVVVGLVVALAGLAAACASESMEPSPEGYITADDGTRLFYRIVGDGPQTVVIPVGFYLEDALARLAGDGRRLVFYDPRGRGRSGAVEPSRVSLDHQVADVEAVRRGRAGTTRSGCSASSSAAMRANSRTIPPRTAAS